MLQLLDGVVGCAQSGTHSGYFTAPEGVEIGLPNTGQKQTILNIGISALQGPKHAHVALKGGDQVVTVPSREVAGSIFVRRPMETTLIGGFHARKGHQLWGLITFTAPDTMAGGPPITRSGEVGAENAPHVLCHSGT